MSELGESLPQLRRLYVRIVVLDKYVNAIRLHRHDTGEGLQTHE